MKPLKLKNKILRTTLLFAACLLAAFVLFVWAQIELQTPSLKADLQVESAMLRSTLATPSPFQLLVSDPLAQEVGLGLALIIGLSITLNQLLKRFSQPLDSLVRAVQSNRRKPIAFESDVEEIRNLTSSYNAMIAQLNRSLDAQRRLNASMAHELRTPLSIIKTQIDVLKAQPEATLADYQETIDVIHVTLRKLNALVSTLLETSQESSESLNEVLNLEEIVLDVVQDLKILAKQKEIDLSVKTENGPSTLGNPVLLYRALYNLIENALKYNQAQGKVHVSLEFMKDSVMLRVADTGIGIPDVDLEHIFEPFYRVKSPQAKEGLGLGLALVQSVVHMHSGTLQVTSKVGSGTVFEIHLPILTDSQRSPS